MNTEAFVVEFPGIVGNIEIINAENFDNSWRTLRDLAKEAEEEEDNDYLMKCSLNDTDIFLKGITVDFSRPLSEKLADKAMQCNYLSVITEGEIDDADPLRKLLILTAILYYFIKESGILNRFKAYQIERSKQRQNVHTFKQLVHAEKAVKHSRKKKEYHNFYMEENSK